MADGKGFLSDIFKFLNTALLMVLSIGVIGILVILIVAAVTIVIVVAIGCLFVYAVCNACSDYSSVTPAATLLLTKITTDMH